jgi:hypothetical protein
VSATPRPEMAQLCGMAERALDRAAAVGCEPDDRVRLAICCARAVFAGTAPREDARFAWEYLFGAEPGSPAYAHLHTIALQLCMVAMHPHDLPALENAAWNACDMQLCDAAAVLQRLEMAAA